MEIRNKFAHVYSVDTFEKCFALTKNYNQLKKLFDIDKEGENQEKDMEYMFISLSLEIANTLDEIGNNIYRQMAVKYTQRKLTEVIKNKREEYKLKKPANAEAVDDFIDFIKVELINEVDEKIKNNVQPHT